MRCRCSHTERVHSRPGTGCEVTACGCKTFRAALPVPVALPARTCPETHDVATGYGTLRCDLPHPHPGLHHHDPVHRIIWAPCGDCCRGAQ